MKPMNRLAHALYCALFALGVGFGVVSILATLQLAAPRLKNIWIDLGANAPFAAFGLLVLACFIWALKRT
jgi:hypothetical protein